MVILGWWMFLMSEVPLYGLERVSPLERGRDGEVNETAQVLGINDAEEYGRETILVLESGPGTCW